METDAAATDGAVTCEPDAVGRGADRRDAVGWYVTIRQRFVGLSVKPSSDDDDDDDSTSIHCGGGDDVGGIGDGGGGCKESVIFDPLGCENDTEKLLM